MTIERRVERGLIEDLASGSIKRVIVAKARPGRGNIAYPLVEIAIAELKGMEMARPPPPTRRTLELSFGCS